MPREKKTRKQKLQTDARRSQVTPMSAGTYTLPISQVSTQVAASNSTTPKPQAQAITTQNYQYLVHDLRKTLILTLAIIVIQVVLVFVMHK